MHIKNVTKMTCPSTASHGFGRDLGNLSLFLTIIGQALGLISKPS